MNDAVLDIQVHHKTFADVFDSLNQAGFTRIPKINELSVPDELVDKKPSMIQQGIDMPLHLVVQTVK